MAFSHTGRSKAMCIYGHIIWFFHNLHRNWLLLKSHGRLTLVYDCKVSWFFRQTLRTVDVISCTNGIYKCTDVNKVSPLHMSFGIWNMSDPTYHPRSLRNSGTPVHICGHTPSWDRRVPNIHPLESFGNLQDPWREWLCCVSCTWTGECFQRNHDLSDNWLHPPKV